MGEIDPSFYGSNFFDTLPDAKVTTEMAAELCKILEPLISPHTSLGDAQGNPTNEVDLTEPVFGVEAIARFGSTFSSDDDRVDGESEHERGIDPLLVLNGRNGQEATATSLEDQQFASNYRPIVSMSVPATPFMNMSLSFKNVPSASAPEPRGRGGRKRKGEELSAMERMARRRAANNRSASKCRNKKNEMFKQLNAEVPVLKERIDVLEKENAQLCKEKEEMERKLSNTEADLAKWKAKALTEK
eukprot:comp12087_c0_seq1/m.6819 comp12087_c0_seq1/g.6819  ORF comp12087_c0_seq1/g.6819 comp12087_c0_seq1/m.6819 type:complete len:245 (-) comp12087_c0_seq1:626-1360(-)